MNILDDRVHLRRLKQDVEEKIRAAGRQARRNKVRADECPFRLKDATTGREYKLLARARGHWLDGYNERKKA